MKKILLMIIIGLILTLLLISCHSEKITNVNESLEKYSGENKFGKIEMIRENEMYSFVFSPCMEIANSHKEKDSYVFNFYTIDNEQKINFALTYFDKSIKEGINVKIKNVINEKDFYKVEIETDKNTYSIPLEKIQDYKDKE